RLCARTAHPHSRDSEAWLIRHTDKDLPRGRTRIRSRQARGIDQIALQGNREQRMRAQRNRVRQVQGQEGLKVVRARRERKIQKQESNISQKCRPRYARAVHAWDEPGPCSFQNISSRSGAISRCFVPVAAGESNAPPGSKSTVQPSVAKANPPNCSRPGPDAP